MQQSALTLAEKPAAIAQTNILQDAVCTRLHIDSLLSVTQDCHDSFTQTADCEWTVSSQKPRNWSGK